MIPSDNKIGSLRQLFRQELSELYSLSEIDSIFYWLMEARFQKKRNAVILGLEERISESEINVLVNDLKRLINAEPIQYVIEHTIFAELTLKVNQDVLIPRPETEELVYGIAEQFKGRKHLKVADLCSGSGCIALGLKKHLAEASVTGFELSEPALKIAKENALKNDLEVSFLQYDILNELQEDGKWDIIVSNPPYVLEGDKQEMHPNVLKFEPHMALFVKDDPLLFYRAIIKNWSECLAENGTMAFEVHERFAHDVAELFEGWKVEIKKDMQRKERMIFAKKS